MNKNRFFEITAPLYGAFIKEAPAVKVPREFADITEKVIAKCGWTTKVTTYNTTFTVPYIEQNNKVMIALSGGLDSAYLLIKLKEKGYAVTACHVRGANKSYSKTEAESARAAARLNNAKYIEKTFRAPRQIFPDNPFKNQLILSIMIDEGVKRGIYRYAVGSDWETPLSEGVTGYTITDTAEVNAEYWNGVQQHFPQAELIFINASEKKYDRLKCLYTEHAETLQNVSSCVTPARYKKQLREHNENKYGIKLMSGRCGSCYKCAMEYLLLCEAGLVPKNEGFYNHSWRVLATGKTSHRPELFAENVPLEERLHNLVNYGS